MDHFNYQHEQLYAEEVPLSVIADQYGTPCYVYSKATLERHWHAFDRALGQQPHRICYAVKANSNLAVLNCLAQLGSGFDIVSVGELERVLAAGGRADRVVFSGVGKQSHEIRRALEMGIFCFNVESIAELDRIEIIAAEMACTAPISLRVNPDVDPATHPYISTGLKENKFGIDFSDIPELTQRIQQHGHLNLVGLDCHIGSQLTDMSPFLAALDRLMKLIKTLKDQGIAIRHLNLGGGLGVRYDQENPPEPQAYSAAILERLNNPQLEIILEPGRAIAANAGVLLTTVEYLKPTPHKHFAIVDAAMNDLLRPALYQAWQAIIPVNQRSNAAPQLYDIVGPVCETGDFLGKARELALSPGDRLAIRSAGAYGFAMSSNYNTRPRCAEVMVDGDRHHLVRARETVPALFAEERIPHWDRH